MGLPDRIERTAAGTGFAQLTGNACRKTYDASTRSWASRLGELADYLDAA